MTRALRIASLALLLLLMARAARAHEMSASLTLEPSIPVPGERGTLTIKLVDPYGVGIPGALVRASVEPLDLPPSDLAQLAETAPGTYSRPVTFPDAVAGVIRVEVVLPDDRWHAMLPIRLGEAWFTVTDWQVELQAGELGSKRPRGPVLPESPPPPAQDQRAKPEPAPATTGGGGLRLVALVGLAVVALVALRFGRR
jgi:hypothetical protein